MNPEHIAALLLVHQYRGSYRVWCSCGEVKPVERHERWGGAVNVAALHRAHLAELIVNQAREHLAAAWDEGFMDAAGQDHPAYPRTRQYINPYEETR